MEDLLSVEGNWRKRRVEPVSRMGEIDHRTFVKLSGASAAALVFGAGPFTEKAMARVRFEDYPFKLGVASGGDGADTTPGNLAVIEENPHIEFFNGQRGYVRCTLTPQEWRADYRVLPYVKQPGAQIYTRASFVTEAGNPGLQQAGETQVPSRPASLVETDVERIRAQESAARGGHR
jgi:phosphodiesterase/alkaline phosphatase D-like protein